MSMLFIGSYSKLILLFMEPIKICCNCVGLYVVVIVGWVFNVVISCSVYLEDCGWDIKCI